MVIIIRFFLDLKLSKELRFFKNINETLNIIFKICNDVNDIFSNELFGSYQNNDIKLIKIRRHC